MAVKHPHSALKVKDLDIGYATKGKSILVAKAIDFELGAGEFAAIVGVNGVGKSTLLRTLGKVQPRLSGAIAIEGRNLQDFRPFDLASKISMVLTESIATKNLTVSELVTLGRQPYTNWIGHLTAEDKAKVRSALKMLELDSLKHKKCYELSDGQLQRVMIARALAQDTSIILLDEPTTHLDLYHKVQIFKLLKAIAKETQKTVVSTTHEIEMAIQLCDKMLLLDGLTNPFGEPCELIAKGVFERLFPSNMVSFDSKTGSFRIEK